MKFLLSLFPSFSSNAISLRCERIWTKVSGRAVTQQIKFKLQQNSATKEEDPVPEGVEEVVKVTNMNLVDGIRARASGNHKYKKGASEKNVVLESAEQQETNKCVQNEMEKFTTVRNRRKQLFPRRFKSDELGTQEGVAVNGEADVQWPVVQGTMSRNGVNAIQLTTCWKREDTNDEIEHVSGDKIISSDNNKSDEVREGGSNTTAESNGEGSDRKPEQSSPSPFRNPFGLRGKSSFNNEEQALLEQLANQVHEAAEFKSFDDFILPFGAYQIHNNSPYRVASSEIFWNVQNNIDQRYRYRYIVFHCAHYGKIRERGSGKRPNQKYLPSGCMARIRLNAHPARGCLRITKFHPYHKGHKHDEEDYLKVIKQRRSEAGPSETKKRKLMKEVRRNAGERKGPGGIDTLESRTAGRRNREIIKSLQSQFEQLKSFTTIIFQTNQEVTTDSEAQVNSVTSFQNGTLGQFSQQMTRSQDITQEANIGKLTSSPLEEDEPGPSGAKIVEFATNSAMNFHGAEKQREEQNVSVDLSRANATNREENGVINLSKFKRTRPEERGDVDPRSEPEASSSIHPPFGHLSGLLPPAITSYQANQQVAADLEAQKNFVLFFQSILLSRFFQQQILQMTHLLGVIRIINIGYAREAECYLEPMKWMNFIFAMLFGCDIQVSDWSVTELNDLTVVLQQPPEALIEKGLVNNITVDEIRGIHFESRERALQAISAEKLKRYSKRS